MSAPLLAAVRDLLAQAATVYAETPEAEVVGDLAARLEEPLRVALVGKVKAGKSTLLNALVGERLAPTDAGECTRIVTWYRGGLTYSASIEPMYGPAEPAVFDRSSGSVEVDLGPRSAADVRRLVIEWPAALLRSVTLIDTPGLGSLSQDVSERTLAFLGDDEQVGVADAVVYLMRHVHHDDVRFLDAFRDDTATGSPVNAVGVLARADEIGGARPDAMESAARIAGRIRLDPTVRRVCADLLPVAGLLAEAAATLGEAEFRALARLAALDAPTVEALLLSSDRFVDPDAATGLAEAERRHLIGRLGLFGVRRAVGSIVEGRVTTSRELADDLRAVSGIGALRGVLERDLVARRDLLKSRAALASVRRLVRRHPVDGVDVLVARLEAIESGAHELAEVRLLAALRAGAVELPGDGADEFERAAGGGSVRERVGLAAEATDDEVRAAVAAAVVRWRRRAEFAASAKSTREAAAVVVRTFEGLAAHT